MCPLRALPRTCAPQPYRSARIWKSAEAPAHTPSENKLPTPRPFHYPRCKYPSGHGKAYMPSPGESSRERRASSSSQTLWTSGLLHTQFSKPQPEDSFTKVADLENQDLRTSRLIPKMIYNVREPSTYCFPTVVRSAVATVIALESSQYDVEGEIK